jgi:ribosome biogenesis GTPase / thiamine phosphate phosphatase
MPQGLIVKALSGYYYVWPDGAAIKDSPFIQCRARGVFRDRGISPLVGDHVSYEITENGEGIVTQLAPRTSELIRPPIANTELAVLVFSVIEPDLNLNLLDKFLVHIEREGLRVVICLTKHDLLQSSSNNGVRQAELEAAIHLYQNIGYDVLLTSAKQGIGIEPLREQLANKISVFSGQSGVGKSSLLNAMIAGLTLETNAISHKLGRGKHTTRHVELLPLEHGGLVADTPGFSQLDFSNLEAEQLSDCFIEFVPLAEHCKFRGCIHLHEPECAVIEAKEDGRVASSRYDHYVQFLTEIKERKRRY